MVHDGEAVLLRLGEPASPIPEPAASLLLDYIADRDHMNTATNQASVWLFPGRRAGQHFRPDHLSALLNEIGVPVAAARGAAIRQELHEMPAPVVADALGYHSKTTTRCSTRPGADTPLAITQGDRQVGFLGAPATVDYESPPVDRQFVH
ncbi:hypothetical protein ACFWCA_34045 [Streptomyces phaeochromogenes]|uniref:hypothetical protein n=1 Tax=Streptomyces phaeochromogenes TaxID=1923 RepID=UPI003689A621